MPHVRIGTSGWSYPSGRGTWNGLFYPPRGGKGFRAVDELPYYAEHFDTVEVNSTFYRPPSPSTAARWVAQTPAEFEFSVKLHQKFTHTMTIGRGAASGGRPPVSSALPQPTPDDAAGFMAGIEPIAASGKLGALLAQFPPGFHHGPAALDYLAQLLETFHDYPVAVELRHRSWSDAGAETAGLLARFQAAWVQIDEPKFRLSIRQSLAPKIARFSYLRLHGRNAAQWWSPEAPEDRYNYLYSRDQLRPFAAAVRTGGAQAGKAYLYLNNHFAAKAVVNAAVLKHELGQPVTGEYRREMLEAYPELRDIVPADDPLVAGTTAVRVAHIIELRQRIDQLRARYALLAFSWTDDVSISGVSTAKAVHLAELRAALSDVYVAADRMPPTYTTSSVVGGTTVITAAQISELRAAVLAIG